MCLCRYDAETYLKIEQALGKKLKVYEAVSDDMWEPLIGKVEEARRYVAVVVLALELHLSDEPRLPHFDMVDVCRAAELEIKESAAETNGQKGKKKRRRI